MPLKKGGVGMVGKEEFDVENYICVAAESFSYQLVGSGGIFRVGGGNRNEREIDTEENVSWNKKWKCTS